MRKRKGREKNQEDLKFTQAFLLKKYLLNTYWVLDSFFPTGDRAAKKAERNVQAVNTHVHKVTLKGKILKRTKGTVTESDRRKGSGEEEGRCGHGDLKTKKQSLGARRGRFFRPRERVIQVLPPETGGSDGQTEKQKVERLQQTVCRRSH